MDNKNEIIGAVAVALVVLALLVGVFAVIHALIALAPILIVGAVVGGLIFYKLKR